MSREAAILRILEDSEISIRGRLVQDIGNSLRYFANVVIEFDQQGKRKPSTVRLQEVKGLLLNQGIELEYLLTDSASADLETGLRATLLSAFPDYVRNAFSAVSGEKAHAWIEPKKILDEKVREAISARVQLYFGLSEIKVVSFALLTEENVPGKAALLSGIRILAPVALADLSMYLTGRGFTIPSLDWLRRRADALRKSGDIVQRHDLKLVLTLNSLRALGTQKNGRSPDVSRMLALTRKKT